jgi:PAS domain S-box-containing protein
MDPSSSVDQIADSLTCYGPGARETVEAAFRRAVKDGVPYDLEVPFVTMKDTNRWVRTIGRPEIVNGKVLKVTGNIVDVTEQHEAADALRASEDKYRQLFEQSVDAVNLVATDGRLLEANPAWHALFGYTPEDAASFDARDVYVDPEGRTRFLESIAMHNRVEDDVQFRRRDGTVFDCHRVVNVRRAPDGQVTGYQTVFHDVTEERRALRALKESEEQYRAIFDQSIAPISLFSPDGRLLEANDAWFRLYGYSRDESKRISARELYAKPEERDDTVRAISDAGFLEDEARVKRKDGSFIDVLRSMVVRRNPDGTILGFQTVARDITELRKTQEQLRRLALRIQEAREEERTVVARELHDHFSQELTALKFDLDTLGRTQAPGTEALCGRLKDIATLVDQMSCGLRTIISELRPGMLDDLGLSAAIEWQASAFSERTGITCGLKLEANDSTLAPETATALFRVLQELLSNVAQHSGATYVSVGTSMASDSVCLTVADNGDGIAEDELNSPSSLGILAIHERIRACDGTASFRGEPGKGTTVTVTVPLQRDNGGWQTRLGLR